MNIGVRARIALATIARDRHWLVETAGIGVNAAASLLSIQGPFTKPRPATIRKAAEALGVSAAWLTADMPQRSLSNSEAAELQRCTAVLQIVARRAREQMRDQNPTSRS
jgi:hypothetical protein